MRRILFQQTDFNLLPNPPAGFNYIGFDGVNFSEKSEDGKINQSVGATGPTGPAGTGGSASSDRLISSNETHNMELVLDNKGTLNIPLMLPVSFTATCDDTHYDGTASFTTSDWWEFEVEFQVSTYGSVAVMMNDIFPILTNPGYVSGYTFRFTEEDHGIPNYNFDIQLNDVQSGTAGWTALLAVGQGPEYPSTIESLGAIKITSDSNSIILSTEGVLSIPNTIEFPFSPGNSRTGSGNNLQFEKGSVYQKIISTQDGTESVPTVERLVISGGDSYNDLGNYEGEGGDIYLWAGKGANGGDIKVDAGESTEGDGGSVKIRGGYSEYNGGFVEITSGYGASGSGGNINIDSGYGSVNGGNISIQAGNGGDAGGNISLSTTEGSWTFKNNGALVFPDSTEQTTAFQGVTDITYSAISTAIDENALIPGSYYRIIDFKTCYDQPNYDIYKQPITTGNYKEGETYPIIVFAISENNISQDAWQEDFPKDKIRYEVGYETTEITGGTAYGRITERIDQWSNRTDYDHREILFKRYDTFVYNPNSPQSGTISVANGVVSGIDTTFTNFSVGDVIAIPYFSEMFFKIDTIESNGTMSLTGSVWDVSANDIKYYSIDYTMDRNSYYKNNINSEDTDYMYEITTFGEAIDNDGAFSNYIGDHSNGFINDGYGDFLLANNVFLDGVYSNNKFGNNCYNNTFDDDCTNNTIGNWFHNNITDDDFDGNQIGNDFRENIITANFQRNIVGENFNNNTIVNDSFYRNRIGENFEDNKISDGDFQNNMIGNQFNNNKVYNDFYKNDIGNGYNYNDVYSNFYGNLIGNAYHENNIYCQFYDNQIGEYYNSNDIGDINNPYDSEFYSNKIGNNFEDNTITDTVNNNVIGNEFENNTILDDFQDNKIGNEFKGNLISSQFELNDIGSFVGSNQFSGGTYQNKFGSYTFDNDFLGNVFNNSCMGGFNNNILGNDFGNNEIGNNFGNNIIDDNFGSGAGAPQGNKIGNNFQDNTIGEYFYNNSIPDNFYNNQIGNFFQWNEINTNINDTNFTLNYGNITGFTYTSGGTGGATGGYSGLTGSVSGGPGSGAAFNVIVSGGTASLVTLSTASTSNQYSINDTITILGKAIGGVTGVDDVVITITDVTSSLFYDHYTKQIFERRLGDKRVSFYDEDDILNVDSIYISSGYIPVYSQTLTFPITYVSFEFQCDGVYSNDGGYTGQTVNNVQELVTLFNANFRQFGYFFDNNDGTLGLYIDPLLKEQYCPNGIYSIYVFND
jgi:hypothetical protein